MANDLQDDNEETYQTGGLDPLLDRLEQAREIAEINAQMAHDLWGDYEDPVESYLINSMDTIREQGLVSRDEGHDGSVINACKSKYFETLRKLGRDVQEES